MSRCTKVFISTQAQDDFLFQIKTSPNKATKIRPVSYTHLDVYKRQVYILW